MVSQDVMREFLIFFRKFVHKIYILRIQYKYTYLRQFPCAFPWHVLFHASENLHPLSILQTVLVMYIYSRINYMNINMDCDTCVWSRCVWRLLHLPPFFLRTEVSHPQPKGINTFFLRITSIGSEEQELRQSFMPGSIWCGDCVEIER